MAQPVGLPSIGEASAADLSPAVERRLGEMIISQGRLDPTFINDPEISQYLNKMAQRLLRHAPAGQRDIEVFALRNPQFNAFAMPGGFIGVNSGVFALADNESELAGVVAHEIAHVTQRHVARGFTQSKQTNMAMMASVAAALLAALAGGANLAVGVAAFGQAAAIDRQLGFSRDAESEADRIGLQMLTGAGYNPHGMETMFGKLMQTSNLNYGTSGGNTYLSTHPLSIDRMTDMQNRTRALSGKRYPDSDDFWYVRAKAVLQQSQDRPSIQRSYEQFQDEARRGSGVRRSAAYLALSELAVRQNDLPKAVSLLDQARQGVPESPYLVRQQAWLSLLSGNAQNAATLARNGLQKWPDHVALSEVLAQALQKMGQHEQAVAVLQKVVDKWPQDYPRFYQMMASSLSSAGKPIEARLAMAKYYEMTGAYPAAIAQLDQARQMTDNFQQQSKLDLQVRQLKNKMARERELLKQFGA